MYISGLWTALITPFTENLEVNYKGLEKLVEIQISSGVDGLLALGTTAETPTLKKSEKEEIVKLVRALTQDKLPLMVGTGTYSTAETIENNKWAAGLGADIALVVNPYYNKPTQAGLIKHFETVANESPIPIYLYNIQGRTGVNLATSSLKVLAENPKILGVKEASGNLEQITDVIVEIQNNNKHFSVLSGDDGLTFSSMCLGARGIISVASNLIPAEVKKLVSLADIGHFIEAKEQHLKLRELFKALFIETNPAPLKAALNIKGLPAGGVRMPLCEVGEGSLRVIEEVLGGL